MGAYSIDITVIAGACHYAEFANGLVVFYLRENIFVNFENASKKINVLPFHVQEVTCLASDPTLTALPSYACR